KHVTDGVKRILQKYASSSYAQYCGARDRCSARLWKSGPRDDADRLPIAIEAAFAAIEQIHRLMSFHDPGSDVSRLNGAQPGQEVGVDAHTSHVLRFAQEVSELSDGAFDVTTAPALVESGFLPAEQARASMSSGATYRDLDLLPGNRARWRRSGWVDL